MALSDLEKFLEQREKKPVEALGAREAISDFVADVDKDAKGRAIFTVRAMRGGKRATSFSSDWTIWLNDGPEGLEALLRALPRIAAGAAAALKLMGVETKPTAPAPAKETAPVAADPFKDLPF
jgi:hypothetical protein